MLLFFHLIEKKHEIFPPLRQTLLSKKKTVSFGKCSAFSYRSWPLKFFNTFFSIIHIDEHSQTDR